MSDLLTEKTLEFIQRRQSRRGLLAMCGKSALMLGAAIAGLHLEARRAYAGDCCNGPWCTDCPPTPGCPPTRTIRGVPYVCCDSGYVGATNTVHQCFICDIGGGAPCECEYDTGQPCP